jgi:hypothetical protein
MLRKSNLPHIPHGDRFESLDIANLGKYCELDWFKNTFRERMCWRLGCRKKLKNHQQIEKAVKRMNKSIDLLTLIRMQTRLKLLEQIVLNPKQ